MTWVRFDDGFSIHRKVAPLDDATFRLHVEAIAWCARNTTDGEIQADELATISVRASKARVAKLVDRKLWHPAGQTCGSDRCPASAETGWVIHDYLEYQPTKERIKAELAAKAERTRRWREGKRGGAKPPRDGQGDASPDVPRDADRDASDDASPPRPAPKEGGGGSPRSAARRHGRLGPAGSEGEQQPTPGASPKCNRCANSLSSAYHRRVCLPSEAEPAATLAAAAEEGARPAEVPDLLQRLHDSLTSRRTEPAATTTRGDTHG